MNQDLIPLARPWITDDDRAVVQRVLETPVLSLGPELTAFEEAFSTRLEGRPCVGVSSGTAALYLALRALGVEGGEVITPSYGFIGTVHAITLTGARPRFVDVDPETLVMTPEACERAMGPDTTALLPVHIYGTPPDMVAIRALGDARGIPVVEDTCEAVGATCDGRPAGSHGHASTFAFYPNKQITSGEGGLVCLEDPEVATVVRSMANQGRGDGTFVFEREGFNFRLNEIQAALAASQVSRLEGILRARNAWAAAYETRLADVPGLATLPAPPPGRTRSWFVYPVFLEEASWRDGVRADLEAAGIQSAPYFPAMHTMSPCRKYHSGNELPVTDSLSVRGFSIPFHHEMGPGEFDRVAEELDRSLRARGARNKPESLPTLLPEPAY